MRHRKAELAGEKGNHVGTGTRYPVITAAAECSALGLLVLTLVQPWESYVGFIHTHIAGPQPQSFPFATVGTGLKMCISSKFRVMLAGPGTSL